MNYFDLPEYASIAPFDAGAARPPVASTGQPASALERLVARIHRRAVAPQGYRFVANLPAEDLALALRAVKQTAVAGELKLITPAVDDAGKAVSDVALYVRDHLPEPTAFWTAYQSLAARHAA